MIASEIDKWDALVVAWLPGTEGAGIADVLFGDMDFTGRTPYTWPASYKQVESTEDSVTVVDEILFPFGYGLTKNRL